VTHKSKELFSNVKKKTPENYKNESVKLIIRRTLEEEISI